MFITLFILTLVFVFSGILKKEEYSKDHTFYDSRAIKKRFLCSGISMAALIVGMCVGSIETHQKVGEFNLSSHYSVKEDKEVYLTFYAHDVNARNVREEEDKAIYVFYVDGESKPMKIHLADDLNSMTFKTSSGEDAKLEVFKDPLYLFKKIFWVGILKIDEHSYVAHFPSEALECNFNR